MKRLLSKDNIKYAAAGLITGLCNGLFGAGGGVAAVLLLERLCGAEPDKAHATAIAIMLPLTAAASVVYIAGGGVSWNTLIYTAPGVLAGCFMGARLTGKMSKRALNRVFALMMLAGGIALLRR